MAGGFQSIIPQLRLGGTTPTQGGFGTPLGVLLVRSIVPGAGTVVTRTGGFGTPIGALVVRSTKTAYGFSSVIPFVPINARIGNKGRHRPEEVYDDIPWPAIWEKQDVEDFEFIMMAVAAIEDSYEIGGEIFEKTKPRTDS